MRVEAKVFSLQKAGNAPDEYEDAYWPEGGVDSEAPSIRLAVADGATETSFSAAWARILVNAYGQGQLSQINIDELAPLQNQWRQQLGDKPLPWYAEEKLRSGAYAALAGLELKDGGRWTSVAVGDSCVFHIRSDEMLRRFPLSRAEQFDRRPLLISSNPRSNSQLNDGVRRIKGSWMPGDVFYLMTDALACYFLRMWKASDGPQDTLGMLNDLSTNEIFESRIRAERENPADGMRNDDVTMIRCRVEGT